MVLKITKFILFTWLLAGLAVGLLSPSAEAVPQAHHAGIEGCRRCHLTHGMRAEIIPGQPNLFSMAGAITTPNSGSKEVIFTDLTGPNSFADGDAAYDGVCEVCHTQTKYFRNDAWDDPSPCAGAPHKAEYAGQDCTPCHSHEDAFEHGGGGPCQDCHGHDDGYLGGSYLGTTTSHSTHTENDADDQKGLGMELACSDCHNVPTYPCFSDSQSLTNTTVCNGCHSPGGGFDGVENGTYGAKALWDTGSAGTDKWCAGCHDGVPSVVQGRTAPDICGDNSTYGYYLGAHGNGSYGVKRQGVSVSKGECAHCHDHDLGDGNPHGKIFADMNPASQTDNFCFQCHKGVGSVQDGGITNNTYSTNFGGGTATFTTVYDAFNPGTGSSHQLSDVLAHAVKVGPTLYSANTNACFACHDVHYAQRNLPVTYSGAGGVLTAVRFPAHIGAYPINLWGDEDFATSGDSERMKDYVPSNYRAPYFYGGSTYEPANNGTYDGSNLPNYKKFCLANCHERADVYSTERGGNLIRLNWSTEQHGEAHGGGGLGTNIAPYTNQSLNYVLSCLDCHEPHGSQNEYLLRTTINGVNVSVPGPGRYWYVCSACHTFNMHFSPYDDTSDCSGCHHHNYGTMF